MRNVSLHIKILLSVPLVGLLYWRDLVTLWQMASSPTWISFTLSILSLILVFLYQDRKALKTLLGISESDNKRGFLLLILAINFYILSPYTTYTLWLRLFSLGLFIAAYLTLIFDFRVTKTIFTPLMASLLAISPNLDAGLQGASVTFMFVAVLLRLLVITFMIISILFRFSERVKESVMPIEPCPLCRSDMFKEELFCYHCGRQRLPLNPKLFKFVFTKLLVLFSIVLVLSFVYVPTFSLADREASLRSYTPHGIEEQTIIPTPEGWKLEYSERLVDYEREHLEDFAVAATYAFGSSSENKSYIQLEIGSGSLYMRNGWQVIGWRSVRQDIALTEFVGGRYVVLQKGNDSITVLYWAMRLMFIVDSVFSTKNVGVSVFSNFTEPITESKVVDVLAEFRRVSISIINWLDFVSRWTLHFYTLNEVYVRFKDVFFTVVSVAVVVVFAGWVRAKDEKVDKLAENASILMEDEAKLLIAISRMKRRRFFGKELFDACKRVAKSEVDLKGFYEKMRKFSMFGLIREDCVLKEGELAMVWKRMFL